MRNFINSLSPNRRYELRTPIIAIAVRGTAFSVRHFAAGGLGTSTVSVDDGIVDIFDRLTGQLLTTLGPGENFSYTQPQVVPEPATSVLLLLAGVPALLRGRRYKQ